MSSKRDVPEKTGKSGERQEVVRARFAPAAGHFAERAREQGAYLIEALSGLAKRTAFHLGH